MAKATTFGTKNGTVSVRGMAGAINHALSTGMYTQPQLVQLCMQAPHNRTQAAAAAKVKAHLASLAKYGNPATTTGNGCLVWRKL